MTSEKLKTLRVKIKKGVERNSHLTSNTKLPNLEILEIICDNLYYGKIIDYRMLLTNETLRPVLIVYKNTKRLDILFDNDILKDFNTQFKSDKEYVDKLFNIQIKALEVSKLFKLYKSIEAELPCPICNNLIPTDVKDGIRIWACNECSFVGMKER